MRDYVEKARRRAIKELRRGQDEIRKKSAAQQAGLEEAILQLQAIQQLQREYSGAKGARANSDRPHPETHQRRTGKYSGISAALLKYMEGRIEAVPLPVATIRRDLLASGVDLGKKRPCITQERSEEGTLFIAAYRLRDSLGYDSKKTRTIWLKFPAQSATLAKESSNTI
jgi:hypothetical protein